MGLFTTKNSRLKFEHAAGFPPYTRGYNTYNFNPKIIPSNKHLEFDFQLSSFSIEAVFELFQTVINKKPSEIKLRLLITTPINDELIIVTQVLRTLLSLINQSLHNKASSSQFCFYIKASDIQNILIEYNYIKAGQIDYFIVPKDTTYLLNNSPKSVHPVNPFFGNLYIEEKTNTLVATLWKKISLLL